MAARWQVKAVARRAHKPANRTQVPPSLPMGSLMVGGPKRALGGACGGEGCGVVSGWLAPPCPSCDCGPRQSRLGETRSTSYPEQA